MRQEFGYFKFLSGKRFHRAHTCKIFFRYRIERRILFTDFLIDLAEPSLHDHCKRTAQKHCCRGKQRKLPIEHIHTHQNNTRMVNHLKQQHTDISHRVPDAVHILLDARHQFTGVCLIKEIRAESLNMTE